MSFMTKIALASVLTIGLFAGPAQAEDTDPLTRVAQTSAEFVHKFNVGDSAALAKLYVREGVLKLPNQLGLNGRDAVASAWQAGFDAGLSNLALDVEVLQRVGDRRVLESGTYRLEIRTPNGVIEQTGTFAVLWKVPWNPGRPPRIIFDAIDAD